MLIFNNIDDLNIAEPTVVTIGKFDGLHRGHRALIDKMQEYDLCKVVFTFDSNPGDDFKDKPLMSMTQRRHAIEECNVDILVECPFTDKVRCTPPEEFVSDILVNKLKAVHLVVGDDFTFGYKAGGNVELLKELAVKYGYTVDVIQRIRYKDRIISSSLIRQDIQNGSIEEAMEMLGDSYEIIRENKALN